jgi:hypothetical protein
MTGLTIAVGRLIRAACLLMILLVAVGGGSNAGSPVPLPAAKYPKTPDGENQCWKEGMESISNAKDAGRITLEIWMASMMGIGVVCGQLSTAHSSVQLSAAMVSALSGNSMNDLVKNAEPLFRKSFEAAPWLYQPITRQ